MSEKQRGLYRERGFAYVTDETSTSRMEEQVYRQRNCQPEYDELPTKEEFDIMTEGGA